MPTASEMSAAFEERLPIDTPDLWDESDLEGHARMSVVRSNARLETVFAETHTDLPKLMASVRWSIFQMSYGDYAKEAGMSTNGYRPMEEDGGDRQPHRIKYTKLLKLWRENAISPGIREQMLELLHEDKEDDTYTFWSRVGYELGHAVVEESYPGFYNQQWQHKQRGVVQKGITFVEMMDQLYPEPHKKNRYRRCCPT